jgi:P27 family predicted phage terminase small subunit
MPTRRKTDGEHKLSGTKSQARPDLESTFPAGRPRMPKHLCSVAADKWRELVRLLAKRGTLTQVDSSALEIFCETFARWRGLCDEIAKHGAMVDVTILDNCGEPHTKRIPNPAAKLVCQLENSMRAMLKEFSATPASREKSKPAAAAPSKDAAPTPDQQFDDFLKRKSPLPEFRRDYA